MCFKISHVFHARLPTRQRLAQSVGRCYKVIGKGPGERYSIATQGEALMHGPASRSWIGLVLVFKLFLQVVPNLPTDGDVLTMCINCISSTARMVPMVCTVAQLSKTKQVIWGLGEFRLWVVEVWRWSTRSTVGVVIHPFKTQLPVINMVFLK